MSTDTTLDTAQMRRVADVPRTTDLARRLLHQAADELDRLRAASAKTNEAIIRDVAELERNPLPGMREEDMLVTADELRAILEARFEEADHAERQQMDHEQYQSTVSA